MCITALSQLFDDTIRNCFKKSGFIRKETSSPDDNIEETPFSDILININEDDFPA